MDPKLGIIGQTCETNLGSSLVEPVKTANTNPKTRLKIKKAALFT